MKKRTLLKTIMIAVLVYTLLTWIIPTGYFSNGAYVQSDIAPIGLFDLIRYPIITMTTSVFLMTGGVVLLIGVLYSVLNKTGVYQSFVEKIAKKYKGNKSLFLVITSLIFLVLSSLTGLDLPLLVMVPFFATVIFLLGYGRFTAMLATIGSILVGNLVSTYGFHIAGYITYYTNNINDSIWYRLGLFILVLGALLFTIIKSSKVKEKVNNDEIMLYEKLDPKVKTKKSSVPMLIILGVCMLITVVGMINWSEVFKLNIFGEAYTNIQNFKIFGYPLFANLLGSMYAYGSWTDYELAMMLVLAIILIALVYKVNFDNLVDAIKKGVKKMLPIVFYILIANIIFLMLNTTKNGYTIFPTIANTIFGLVEGFNGIIFGIVTFIGSFFYNDFPYLLGALYDPATTTFASDISIVGMLAQGIHGLVQIIAPTGILLVVGLTYFDIPYGKWLKEIFKFILLALVAIIIIVILMTIL